MPFQKGHKPYAGVFKRGQSGNPGGDQLAEFQAAAKTAGLAALYGIMKLAVQSDSEELRFRADQFLVSYGFAKPQEMTVHGDTEVTVHFGFEVGRLRSRTRCHGSRALPPTVPLMTRREHTGSWAFEPVID